jgi:hypothetical protein
LVYNSELLKEPDATVAEKFPVVPVYKGTVEFITLEDWKKELKVLVEECSTQEKYIYAIPPIDETSEAYAAWQKIEQVYGKGSMVPYCKRKMSCTRWLTMQGYGLCYCHQTQAESTTPFW